METIMLSDKFYSDFFYRTIGPKVFEELKEYGPYDRAIYLECFDGRLIEFVQANEIHGIDNPEIKSVPIVKRIDEPDKVYDLILLTEKDYETFTEDEIFEWIRKCGARIVAVVGTDTYFSRNKYVVGWPLKIIELTSCIDSYDNLKLKIYQFDASIKKIEESKVVNTNE